MQSDNLPNIVTIDIDPKPSKCNYFDRIIASQSSDPTHSAPEIPTPTDLRELADSIKQIQRDNEDKLKSVKKNIKELEEWIKRNPPVTPTEGAVSKTSQEASNTGKPNAINTTITESNDMQIDSTDSDTTSPEFTTPSEPSAPSEAVDGAFRLKLSKVQGLEEAEDSTDTKKRKRSPSPQPTSASSTSPIVTEITKPIMEYNATRKVIKLRPSTKVSISPPPTEIAKTAVEKAKTDEKIKAVDKSKTEPLVAVKVEKPEKERVPPPAAVLPVAMAVARPLPAAVPVPLPAAVPRPPLPKRASQTQQKKRHKRSSKYESSFPSTSLPLQEQDTAASMVLQGDFSQMTKPTQQVSGIEFWKYMDQFFRPLTDDDLNMLKEKSDDWSSYIVPRSRDYHDIWEEEDAKFVGTDAGLVYPSVYREPVEYLNPSNDPNEVVREGEFRFGTLTERILGALVEDRVVDVNQLLNKNEEREDDDDGVPRLVATGVRGAWDSEVLEERVKRELIYLGLIDEKMMDPPPNPEDTYVQELVSLQAELRELTAELEQKKSRVYNVAKSYKALEEYHQILDDVGKQVESAYTRRNTAKKKMGKARKPFAPSKPLPDSVLVRMSQYRKAKRELEKQFGGGLFTYAPTQTIFGEEEPEASWERFTSKEYFEKDKERRNKAIEEVHPAVKRAPFVLGMPGCWVDSMLANRTDEREGSSSMDMSESLQFASSTSDVVVASTSNGASSHVIS